MRKSTFFAILVIAICILTGTVVNAQTAIKVQTKRTSKATFTNTQGFILPASVSDTTRVYESARGSQYYWRQSKKSGNIYKVYLPKTK